MILRLGATAQLCGMDRTTLWRWTKTDVRVRACLFKRGWYVIEKLAAIGMCQMPAPRPLPPKVKHQRRSACA